MGTMTRTNISAWMSKPAWTTMTWTTMTWAILALLVGVNGVHAQSITPQPPGAAEEKHEPVVVKAEVERKGRTGRDVILGTYLTLSKDCKVGAAPKVEFPTPPEHGKTGTRTSAINLRLVPGAPRKNCIGTSPNGVLVYFRPERRFKGEDALVFRVVYPNGDAREVTAKVIVQ
jgi:hypothetical protein